MFLQGTIVLFAGAQTDYSVYFAAVFYEDYGGYAVDLEFFGGLGVLVHVKFSYEDFAR